MRVVYDVYGVEFAADLGLLTLLGVAAAVTIIYGSVNALSQDHLKKRLAYSTVSQISYIALGTAILGPLATIGGVGRRMPGTTLAFTIGALGMIGIPPVAGFVSKWFIGVGAVEAGAAAWVLPVLVASSLLNAAYFLPILYRAWFREPPVAWPAEHPRSARLETTGALLWPPAITAVLALAAGLFAAAPYSPLEWAELIAEREYR